MKNLSIAIVAVLSLVSFAGCKKGGAADAINKMTEFKDKMCACKDKACADKVSEEMNKWGSEQKGDKEAKVTEDDAKKMAAVTEEFSKCMTKLMMPDTTGTAPAAPAAPAGDKPADPAAAPAGTAPAAPAGDKPADPAAAPAGDKKPDDKK
jgi:hypothetical protein